MLILTRKAGESLHLGDDIRITVLGIQGKQVKIGIEVPGDMVVYRRVIEENRMALDISNADLLAATKIWHGRTK